MTVVIVLKLDVDHSCILKACRKRIEAEIAKDLDGQRKLGRTDRRMAARMQADAKVAAGIPVPMDIGDGLDQSATVLEDKKDH